MRGCINRRGQNLLLLKIMSSSSSSSNAAKKYKTDPKCTPVFCTLAEFSRGSSANLQRCENLVQNFTKRFGHAPHFIARAPGRVNLIGEHVDYCGYSVLPMALEQDITMAVASTDDSTITLVNTIDKYTDHTQPATSCDIKGHQWYDYFLCGYRGILEEFKVTQPRGLQVMVDGNIPPSAGLSSSSALVCCSSLVALFGNDLPLQSKVDIANLCAVSEKFIGTQGGGMDQAISFLAEPGKALKIDFNPLTSTEVSLPSGYAFVIANSLVEANKAAFSGFNERVVECQLATKLIAKVKGFDWQTTFKLAEAQKLLNLDLGKMVDIVKECLHEEPYTHSEICQLLEIPDGQLVEEVLPHMSVQARDAAARLQRFKLYQRAMHVYNEAHRVIKFKETTEIQQDPHDTGIELGALMTGSHDSCSGLYECSCPQLDQLVKVCQEGGACGARLTGAGWGGCTVSIVPESKLSAFMDSVADSYYKRPMSELSTTVFATNPGPGAAYCDLTKNRN